MVRTLRRLSAGRGSESVVCLLMFWTPVAVGQADDVDASLARRLHEQEVMKSSFCAGCHPDIYAEHEQNTHGRAFTDEEVRLATGRFAHGDCIVCHTPRPIFETGIGMNPKRRHFNLEEGNTCMTCHWRPGYDYSGFKGGAQCKEAFDERVGAVEACASCHRNHGTPYQWELSPLGKAEDRACIECHMPTVVRPVAVGTEPRAVYSHLFPGSRSESQIRRAYDYEAAIEGNEVVITIHNKGAGHNFPTELRQRSLESLVRVRDEAGTLVAESRLVLRDPYKRPYGFDLLVNTQIPSGQKVTHRVPIKVPAGSVDCELHFKLYYPIEDHHPDLSRQLETRRFVFDAITPSDQPVESAPEIKLLTALPPEIASPANLVDFARPPIDKVEVDIPSGDSADDVQKLIELFQFPVPQANEEAQKRLLEIGDAAIPALIEALGSWDNKTFNQSMAVLGRMGERPLAALVGALEDPRLYVRLHARELLVLINPRELEPFSNSLVRGLTMDHALDRSFSAETIGRLGMKDLAPRVEPLLDDRDPDVVRAVALALSRLDAPSAIPKIRELLSQFIHPETCRDLAVALVRLGSVDGVPVLLSGLDLKDDLVRESYFEQWFAATGLHFGYDPLAPREERLEAIARLQCYWSARGSAADLRPWPFHDLELHNQIWKQVTRLVEGHPGLDVEATVQELIDHSDYAVPALVLGLKYPPGFADKRQLLCEILGAIGSKDAVPALIAATGDPVIQVALAASWALQNLRDENALGAVQRLYHRVQTLHAHGRIPGDAGPPDEVLASVAHARLLLGEKRAACDLVPMLLSPDLEARKIALDALMGHFGSDYGYDPEATLESRRAALKEWMRVVNEEK